MDEYGMGSFNLHSFHGPVLCPHPYSNGEFHVAGGSSGGSAAAVAANMCYGALGSDTGGSVRLPAAYCGVVGFKPSYGRLSRHGLIAFASSLDCPGILARTVNDVGLIYDVIKGMDEMDSTCIDGDVEDKPAEESADTHLSVVVGVPQEYAVEGMSEEAVQGWQDAVDAFGRAGARTVLCSLPHTSASLPAYYVIASAEASSNLARYDGVRYGLQVGVEEVVYGGTLAERCAAVRSMGFGEEVKRRILTGAFVLSSAMYHSYFEKAQRVRSLVTRDFEHVFGAGVDVLLTPVITSPPPTLDQALQSLDPVSMYINDVMTVPASLAGLPAIAVPLGRAANGSPRAVQLIGRPFKERQLLAVARALEFANKAGT
mmetsp:Transcript_30246/g.48861  ORF Transcript_30246/g.48861 Transcript_30246/m.48861 type:complete len:372 (+) Transcript_30246:430-1545(+)